jgi:arylsulfatase A-like enzyme
MLIDYIHGDLQREDRRPFFAVLSVQPPHNPYAAPAEFMDRHSPAEIQLRPNVPNVPRVVEQARRQLAGYYAQIENLDWNLGRVEQALEQTGQRLNTHIIFFSDHGDMQGSHGQFGKVLPYEESIRIPFIIGGEIPRTLGRKTGRINAPINHVDIAPTTLGLCGIEAPGWMEGTDYSHYRLEKRRIRSHSPEAESTTSTRLQPDVEPPSLYPRDRGDEPDSAFLQVPMPREYIDKPWRGITTRDGWKYVCFERQAWLMFNLNEDPYELVNLGHNRQFAKRRKELNDRLAQWIDDTGDAFELPR